MGTMMEENAEPLAWPRSSILVVDDEAGMRSFLTRSLSSRCAHIEAVESVAAAERLMRRFRFDLLILDIKLPDKTGVEWLGELRDKGFVGDVILITAYADLDTAIHALRAGASDFLLKPFRLPQLINAIQRCHERSRLARENFVLRREVGARTEGVVELIGESQTMREVRALIQRLAPLPSTVLITGESGTGKEVAARALHRMSPRGHGPLAGPFVPLNCAAISPELMESELFGHVRGAFTGATQNRDGLFYYANGGTLFLDEIAELPLPLQAKLLRVLEERKIRPVGSEQEIPVDVRIVAATNRRLADEVAVSRFRQDLYYRLQVVEIHMPALREHAADIPLLVDHFNHKLAQELGVPPMSISHEVLRQMMADYDWPGNVRELRNWVERSLILGEPRLDFLPHAEKSRGHDASLEEIERRHIVETLKAVGGNKSEAARRLGISRKTLERRCAAWGL
ncbi:MAG: sigma-54 dependent transcriptional regulator [Rhodocyclaceae bacterium]|nr:sigma-54 dependent transcriptional regulator [Rhodocyclaceae bacterium]